MNTAFARTARKSCSRNGSKRYPGPSTASPARRRWNRGCCSPTGYRHEERPALHGWPCAFKAPFAADATLAYILSFIIKPGRADFSLRDGRRLSFGDGSGMAEGYGRWFVEASDAHEGAFPCRVQNLRSAVDQGPPRATRKV